MFNSKSGDDILLFTLDKVYEYKKKKGEVLTQQAILDYLSGEVYKTESQVHAKNTLEYLENLTGKAAATSFEKLNKELTESFNKRSKAFFKDLGYSHWSANVKLTLYLFMTVVPAIIAISFMMTSVGVMLCNKFLWKLHTSEISKLEVELQELEHDLKGLDKSKKNK